MNDHCSENGLGCPCCLETKKHREVEGSLAAETAASYRRPWRSSEPHKPFDWKSALDKTGRVGSFVIGSVTLVLVIIIAISVGWVALYGVYYLGRFFSQVLGLALPVTGDGRLVHWFGIICLVLPFACTKLGRHIIEHVKDNH